MEIETLAEIEIEEIDKIGPKGLSAYEVYVKNGGTLSETEWLKSLRGEQGLQGKPGAVKMQVVDTLPDVGETDTIYLLKKDTPGEQNLYDEYVYTETTGWEHIGDTSVDLTDYYTKEEMDEKLNNIAYSLDLPNSGGFLNLNSLDYQKINDYVNYCKDINRWVPIQLSTRDYKNGELPIFNIYSSTNFANINFSFITIRACSNYETLFTFDFYGSWGEDGYHVSGGRSKRQDNITPLYRNNTSSYTPTDEYNPATKKYVDDNKYTLPVASADTLGGIMLGDQYSVDTTGGLESNAYLPVLTLYTDRDTMWIGHRRYSSNENYTEGGVYDTVLAFLNKKKYNWFYVREWLTNYSSSMGGTPYHINYVCMWSKKTDTIYSDGTRDLEFISSYFPRTRTYTPAYSRLVIRYQITDGVIDLKHVDFEAAVDVIPQETLIKTNTTAYTPTSNYNPSTKLYTDKTHYENMTGYDATKTQVLKNVNGTLTWVDEE